MTFEEAMEKLQSIASNLEDNNNSLSKSIEFYKESIELVNFCEDIIKKAEQEIVDLNKDN